MLLKKLAALSVVLSAGCAGGVFVGENFKVGSSATPYFSNVQVPLSTIKRETQDVSFWVSFSIPSLISGNTP